MGFLVDYLAADGSVERRIYVQTSSTGYPAGFFPEKVLQEHPVDVALLAMDCANLQMDKASTVIDFLQPKSVFFCHWENFFRRKDQAPREIVKVDLPKARRFFQGADGSDFFFPGFDTVFDL